MERLSCTLAGRAAFCALVLTTACVATLLELVPGPLAVLAGLTPLLGALLWEVVCLRRTLAREQAAHRDKSAYLANMSHELRTPLNAILGFSELIGDGIVGADDQLKTRECARDIHQAANHLLRLINDVLDLSKLDAGRMELSERPTDVEEMLLDCQRLLHEQVHRAGLQMAITVDGDLPPLRCDPLKVTQVLLNLMANAVKFTPAGGHIRIQAVQSAGGTMSIAVHDDGIGIAADDLSRVLTPFTQAAPSSRTGEPGTGLGLPLSKRLMELHGGRLELRSQAGVGTCVTVVFPAQRCLGGADRRPTPLCDVPAHA